MINDKIKVSQISLVHSVLLSATSLNNCVSLAPPQFWHCDIPPARPSAAPALGDTEFVDVRLRKANLLFKKCGD